MGQHVEDPPRAPAPQAVCLIRPRAAEAFRFSAQSLSLPLGLAYLAAALEQAGHAVSVLDAVGLAPDRRQRYVQGYLVDPGDRPADSRDEAATTSFAASCRVSSDLYAARPAH